MQQQVSRPKTAAMLRIELARGRPIEELLAELYEAKGLTYAEIAADLGITEGALSNWMWRLGITPRRPGQRKATA
jgi:DNA-directed RNA polymerase specialized sigma24 family protein